MDRNTRNDPYWNRCVFLGASGVFESDGTEDVGEDNGNHAPPQIHQSTQRAQEECESESSRISRRYYRDSDYGQRTPSPVAEDIDPQYPTGKGHMGSKISRRSRYQADLDSYLNETYGKRG